jgi:PCO_ADO
MNPEMRRVVNEAEAAARRGWSDSVVDALAASTRALRCDAAEVARLLALPVADHGFREEVFMTDPSFHASVFAVDAGEVIPLHDHPSLDVITKVLRGRIRVRTYEWIDAVTLVAGERGEIVIGEDDDPLVLRKWPGTLHTVTALEPTVFLDLFAPYYDDVMRPCRYYKVAGLPGREVAEPLTGQRGNSVTLRMVSWEEARV